jgi:hypothetical protein
MPSQWPFKPCAADAIALEARYLAALTPAERGAIFAGLERTTEAILASLPAEERRRRRDVARSIDPRPTPWWRHLRVSARPSSHAAS